METIDTAEPDEFARLLAQLNGDPAAATPAAPPAAAPLLPPSPPPAAAAPLPAAAAPAAPSPLFPPQPTAVPASVPPAAVPLEQAPTAAEPPSTVAPPVLAPVPPALAPAFGLATPMPTLPARAADPVPASPPSIAFPPVAAPGPITPPAPPPIPPVTLAPELMGADELAAPPSSSTLAARVEPDAPPSLVSPPSAVAAALAAAPPPGAAAPPASAPPPTSTVLPAPSSPAPAMTAAAPAASPSSAPPIRPAAPLDFASLLSTPVGADDAPSAAAVPLVFGTASPDAAGDEADIGSSTLFEKIGLVLAVLVAPIGLIVGIASAVLSVRRRGWVVGIVRATIAVGAVLTVALGVGGYYEYTQYQQQQHHDQIAAESAAFCATLKADPSMYQPPTFGWPAVAASIPDTLTAMQAFEDRWTKLAKVSPAGIKGDVTKEATAAKQIIDSVTVARVVDDASNIAVMSSVASSSSIPAWHSEYCG